MSRMINRGPGPYYDNPLGFSDGVALPLVGSGAPVDGTTGAGIADTGSLYVDSASGSWYTNTGDIDTPAWEALGTVTSDSVNTAAIQSGAVTAAKLADALAGLSDGLGMLRVARATFNPSATAGQRTIAAHGLGVTIPNKAIVCGGFLQVNTTFADGASDNATIAISVEGANDIVSAIAISNGANPWDAGLHAIIPKANTPEVTGIPLTTDREITATVAVHALTAGKATIVLYYVMGA